MKGTKGFAALQALKNEMTIERETAELRWTEGMNKRYQERMEKRGFRSPDEMIDYLMSGKKIIDRDGQSFQLVEVLLSLFMKFMMNMPVLRVLVRNMKHLLSLRILFMKFLTSIRTVNGCLIGLRRKSTNFNY